MATNEPEPVDELAERRRKREQSEQPLPDWLRPWHWWERGLVDQFGRPIPPTPDKR